MRIPATALLCLTLASTAIAVHAADSASAGKRKKGPQTTWRFPIKGEHDYGGRAGRFGFKRPDGSIHTGQDMNASCGQPLVAVHRARVLARAYSSGTGYYVVLDGLGTRFDFVYAHMKGPGGPKKGRIVKRGRRIGYVGHTGTSTGICHLHLELWKGRWFEGGRRIDPLKRLRRWDKFS